MRFELPSGDDTTWTALNLDAFPPRTPDDFHAMVSAQRAELPGGLPNPLRLLAFLAPRGPLAVKGIQAAATLKPPKSFATARFNGFHAYWLVDAVGPAAGVSLPLDAARGDRGDGSRRRREPPAAVPRQRDQAARGAGARRVAAASSSSPAPTTRPTTCGGCGRSRASSSTPGQLVIDREHEDPELVDTYVFDPTRMPPGIELSDDPLLHFRSEAYAESHRRRTHEERPAIKPE